LLGFYILSGFLSLIYSAMSVEFLVGRILRNLVLGFCIRVETPLKCFILFYLFFADKKKVTICLWSQPRLSQPTRTIILIWIECACKQDHFIWFAPIFHEDFSAVFIPWIININQSEITIFQKNFKINKLIQIITR